MTLGTLCSAASEVKGMKWNMDAHKVTGMTYLITVPTENSGQEHRTKQGRLEEQDTSTSPSKIN